MKKIFLTLFTAALVISSQNILSYAECIEDEPNTCHANIIGTSQNNQGQQLDFNIRTSPFLANIIPETSFISQGEPIIFGIFNRSPSEVGSTLTRPAIHYIENT